MLRIAALFSALTVALAAQTPPLVRQAVRGGSLEVPAGWKVETSADGANWTLQAWQDPSDGAAATVVVYGMVFEANRTAAAIVDGMVKEAPGTRLTGRESKPDGDAFPFTYPLETPGGGHGVFFVQPRPAQRLTLVLALMGSRGATAQAGGLALLRRIAASLHTPGTVTLPVVVAPSPRPPAPASGLASPFAGEFVRIPEVVFRTPGFPGGELPGAWGEGQGSVITQVQQRRIDDQTLEEISRMAGTQGRARVVRFLDGNRYQWLTTTEVSDPGCLSRGAVTETGTYVFDGTTLLVRPQAYDGQVFVCSPADRQRQRGVNPPPRRYQVFTALIRQALTSGGPTRRALLLIGPCADHLTECGYQSQVQIVLQKF
jgi:hypothetical protein